MANIPYYQIDAFTTEQFSGNPAGVCLLKNWLSDQQMQSLAAQVNLSETAFVISHGETASIRWFSPTTEINLCGHATLAACLALNHTGLLINNQVTFESASGPLFVRFHQERYHLNLPHRPGTLEPTPPLLEEALGEPVLEFYRCVDHLVVLETEEQVRKATPNLKLLAQIEGEGVIITAPGTNSDFVCRVFAPQVGIPEDPVTGSAHCTLVPYWSRRLGKNKLVSHQVSERGGEVICELHHSHVSISGRGRLRKTLQLVAGK